MKKEPDSGSEEVAGREGWWVKSWLLNSHCMHKWYYATVVYWGPYRWKWLASLQQWLLDLSLVDHPKARPISNTSLVTYVYFGRKGGELDED